MKHKLPLYQRFIIAIVIYTSIILALWLFYHGIVTDIINRSAKENTILAADNITDNISAELLQMKTITSVITSSSYIRDFLTEQDVHAYYEKSSVVSEIIQKAASTVSETDSVITINSDGEYFRFIGGLSNSACEELYKHFVGEGSAFKVIELDNTLFFCHNAPVFDYSGQVPVKAGNVIILTGLNKISRKLDYSSVFKGMDTAVMQDGKVIMSNNPSFIDMTTEEFISQYGFVSTAEVTGTHLTVSAAVRKSNLSQINIILGIISLILLCLLLAVISILYRYLSKGMIKPMADIIVGVRKIGDNKETRLHKTGIDDFDTLADVINDMLNQTEKHNIELMTEREKLYSAEILKQKMRIGLLTSQMDAHFVVNTLKNIKSLSDQNENVKAAQIAEGLALMLKHSHSGEALVNIFADFEVLEQYISIMNIRYNDKFEVSYNVDDTLADYMIMGLILQPIVENAITHGLSEMNCNAKLVINGFIKDNKVCFEISDNGKGITKNKLALIQDRLLLKNAGDFPEPSLNGVALINIERRIKLKYGEQYGISIESEYEKGTTVTVVLPIIPDV